MSRADKIRQVAQQAHDNGDCDCDCDCDTTISRTEEFEADERSSVVEDTHTMHPADVERATSATKRKFTESVCFPTQQTPWEQR